MTKNFDQEKNLPQTRAEEEEQIKKYIEENTDLDEKEAAELMHNLDLKTIAAFETAMDKVAKEYERERSQAEILYEYIREEDTVFQTKEDADEYIREENLKEKLGKKTALLKNPPQGLSSEEVEEILTNIDAYKDLDNLDIIETDKDVYYYDILLWTGQYADTAVILEEKDINKAIATRARRDCKIYPRPLQVTALYDPPYNYKEEEILRALKAMEADENYQDIKVVQASNGGKCIYSTDEMSEKYAKSLCEYLEVESKEYQ